MTDAVLKAQIWKIIDDSAENQSTVDHTIDTAYNSDDAPYYISEWDTNQGIVVWSSDDDDQNEDVEYRTKVALLQYNASKETKMTQETWEVPLNTPPPEVDGTIIPKRFGTSRDILIAGPGGPDECPTVYDADTDTFLSTWETVEPHLSAPPAGTFAFAPLGFTDGRHDKDLSASMVMNAAGQILYARKNNNERNSRGYTVQYYSSFANFEAQILGEPRISNLNGTSAYYGPALAIWMDPDTEFVYLFVSAYDSVPGDPDSIAGPTTEVYLSEDFGTTWTLHSNIQEPGTYDENDWTVSWTWADSFTASANESYCFQSDGINRIFIGQPVKIDATTWVISAPFYGQRSWNYGDVGNFTEMKDRYVGQAIYKTIDACATWTKEYEFVSAARTNDSYFDAEGQTIQFKGVSRNLVEYRDKLYIAIHPAPATESLSGDGFLSWNNKPYVDAPYVYCSADNGTTWTYAGTMTTNPSKSLEFFAHIDETGEEALYLLSGSRYLYKTNADPSTDTSAFNDLTLLRMFTNISFDKTYQNMITKLRDDYVVLLMGEGIIACDIIDPEFHNGLSVFIIDQCSSES